MLLWLRACCTLTVYDMVRLDGALVVYDTLEYSYKSDKLAELQMRIE